MTIETPAQPSTPMTDLMAGTNFKDYFVPPLVIPVVFVLAMLVVALVRYA